jgi:hypothetical protein
MRLASLQELEPTLNDSRICAILPQIRGELRIIIHSAKMALWQIRAELRNSRFGTCPKTLA